MTKLTNPLFSFSAKGTIARAVTYFTRQSVKIARIKPDPPDARSLVQMSWRHMYLKAVALWHALSPAEQFEWQQAANHKHMTGYAWFMSQALRPNPGLYLPLQGGTMTGTIEMAGHPIEGLDSPVLDTEPLTLADYNANIAPYLYHEGTRVYQNVNQQINSTAETTLSFNSEQYDTDTIHSTTVNPSRLTCRTAGKYLISVTYRMATNGLGIRRATLKVNGGVFIARDVSLPFVTQFFVKTVTTVYDLSIGDYVEVSIFQNSGVALNAEYSASYSPYFMMQRIG